jgi:peptidylprolyl isomerase
MNILVKLVLIAFIFSFCQCAKEKPKKKKTRETLTKKIKVKETLEKEIVKPWDSLNKENVEAFFTEYGKQNKETKVLLKTKFGAIKLRL